MSDEFFKKPILNSLYEYPSSYWEMVDGLPTQHIVGARREAEFVTPIPKPRKRKDSSTPELFADSRKYDPIPIPIHIPIPIPIPIINELRRHVDAWRKLPSERDWLVMPDTARLLKHWRRYITNYHALKLRERMIPLDYE